MAIPLLIKLLAGYEAGMITRQIGERIRYYKEARAYADTVGKPLLNIGMQRAPWQMPNGDVTVDLDPKVLTIPGGVMTDERDMPFGDKEFAIVVNSHTLEHLPDAQSVEQAVNECLRVADKAIIICPSPYELISNMFCPGHHLRLWFDQTNNRIKVTDNRWKTGLGYNYGPKISQAMVIDTMPEVIKTGNTYLL